MNEFAYRTTEADVDHTTTTPTNPILPTEDTGWRLVSSAVYNHDTGNGVMVPRVQWYWERRIAPPTVVAGPQGPQGPQGVQGPQGGQGA